MEINNVNRRDFIKSVGLFSGMLYLSHFTGCNDPLRKDFPPQNGASIYLSQGKSAEENTRALIDSFGGIQRLIDKDDIVILKPNSQWWYQGMTNTDSMKAFIEMVLDIPGFAGEIIIADNHQDKLDESRGWTTDKPNGRYNLNGLVAHFNDRGFSNVTKYHWHPASANPTPLQMGGSGNAVISHPSEGDGYIWPKDLYYESPLGTRTILAYPVFTSAYSGVTIDLKDGAFKKGEYTGQPVKFINYSALNHHSGYVGVTASIKNFMGVVDMSCGYPAPYPEGFYNTHYVGVTPTFKIIRFLGSYWRTEKYFKPQLDKRWAFKFKYTGGVLGKYIREIRKPDLNIMTAQVVGWGARIDPQKAYESKTILASDDPVALDYWAAKHVLLPATRASNGGNGLIELHDPDILNGPFREFLEECRRENGGTVDGNKMKIIKS